nr:DUF3017 domain-containing protein [Aeromicrobium sp. CFBP 8757]
MQLVAVVAGLTLIALGQWRLGVGGIGLAFVAGALARSVVPIDHTGMLRVRGKAFDIVWMTTLGVALLVLPFLIPNQPG